MRPLLLSLLLVTHSWGAITYVQSKIGTETAANTASATFTDANVTPGSVLVAFPFWNSYLNAYTITGVSDGTHNFTQGTSCYATDGAGPGYTSNTDFWYLPNAAGGNKPTITVTLSGTSVHLNVYIAEYSGADTAAPFDKCAIGHGGSNSSLATATLTLAGSNEMLVAAGVSTSYTAVAGSGFTGRRTSSSSIAGVLEDQGPTSSNLTGTATTAGSGYWAITMAALVPGASPNGRRRVTVQ